MKRTITRIGSINSNFESFNLKDALTKNDAGDWGDEPKEGAIPVIRSTNFTNEGKLDLKDVAYRSLKPNKLSEKKLFENEIIIERSGGSETQPVGRVGLVNHRIGSSNFAFANFIQRIALNDTVDANYIFYCLQQMYEMGITRAMQYQTTGIRNLDWKLYTKSILPKPPKPEQTAIATILSKVDEAIAATQNSIKAAEKLKKALMQNLLTGKLKPDGSWRTEDEFYEDEKFGKVPLGWEVKKLKDVCICGGQYGANASAVDFVEGKPRYIRITDIDDLGNLIEENKAGIEKDKVKDYLLKDNDFLFARTGDTVGKSLLYKEEMGLSAYAGYLIKFTFNEELILAEYFNLVAKSDIFEAFKVAMQRVGAKPNINSREYGSFRFPLSNDINEQQLIFEQAKPINESISRKQTKIQTLQRLKKSLMQNLLTGKVHLPKEVVERLSKLEKEVKNA